jgi:hypothetical protein
MILYLILLMVIFILLYNKLNKLEGFEEDVTKDKTQTKKCLLVYYGGAFREGNIGTTIQDTNYGYEAQERASITHAKLKKVLNKKGFQTDIIINTRSTKYTNKLEDWYNPFNMIVNNLSNKIHGKEYIMKSTIDNINKLNKNDYDFMLFIRIDLFLKPEFYNVLNTESDKINFLANNYNPRDCNYIINGNPSVVDLFIYIPRKYYYILDNNFNLNHNSWDYYKKKYKLTNFDMGFMTNMKFDSNTYIDKNPFYVMSSRKENKHLHENKTTQICPKYNENTQSFIDFPENVYLNENKDFYLDI